jgi:hypothetical protein
MDIPFPEKDIKHRMINTMISQPKEGNSPKKCHLLN